MPFSFKTFAIFLFVLAVSYFSAVATGFYWKNPWVDIPLHFLGGVVAALFGAIYFKNQLENLNKFAALVFILGFAALIGVLWEFFEWGVDAFLKAKINQATVSDTLGDLAIDLMGGLAVFWLYNLAKAKIIKSLFEIRES